MDLTTSKGRSSQQGMRVAPRCRGAASSMLRLSHSTPSVFGGLGPSTSLRTGRVATVAQRLTQSLAMLPLHASAAAEPGKGERAVPLFTRLWPSASFGCEALWQDTLVALD